MAKIQVGKAGELKDGSMQEVEAQGRQILLARVGDRYYAVSGRCPHMGGNLSRGKLAGTIITCPLHGSRFDLSDGHVVRWTKWSGLLGKVSRALKSPRPLATYRVSLEGDRLLVEF